MNCLLSFEREREKDTHKSRQIQGMVRGRQVERLPVDLSLSSPLCLFSLSTCLIIYPRLQSMHTFRYSFVAFESLMRSHSHSSLAHSIWMQVLPALSSVFLPSAKLTCNPIRGNYLSLFPWTLFILITISIMLISSHGTISFIWRAITQCKRKRYHTYLIAVNYFLASPWRVGPTGLSEEESERNNWISGKNLWTVRDERWDATSREHDRH